MIQRQQVPKDANFYWTDMKSLFLLLVAILANHDLTTARNPGLKLKLSERGLDYAARVAVEKLSSDVRTRTIDDISGSSGRLSYGISDVRIVDFTSPGSIVTTDPGRGITTTLRNVGLSVHGNWNYQWEWWIFEIRDSGSFDMSVSGVTLTLSLGMGVDDNGRPTMWIKSRDSLIGDVHLRFHGGVSWLYNLFSGYAEWKIAGKLRSELNDALDKLINEKAKKTLQNVKVRVPVKDLTTLDYRLVAAPETAADYILFSHRGEFVWTQDNTGIPVLPPPIEDLTGTPKMIKLCMSDYISNSLGYILYKRGNFFLRYNLTESDLPTGYRSFLKLARYTEIAEGRSNGTIHLLMYATKPPTLHTDRNDINSYIRGTVEMKTRELTGEMATFLTLDVTANITIIGRVARERIMGHVRHLGLNTTITASNVNEQIRSEINSLMTVVSEFFLVPKLNEIGRTGYPMPNLDNVKYISPQFHLLKNTVCISTDVKYEP